MITIFDIQNINKILQENKINYILKLKDVCGSQSLSLVGDEDTDLETILSIINNYLKANHIKVTSSTINPYNLNINKR